MKTDKTFKVTESYHRMNGKLTFKKIYQDFKDRHPNLKKTISYWRPHDYLKIFMIAKDGTRMLYDYSEHKVIFIDDGNVY